MKTGLGSSVNVVGRYHCSAISISFLIPMFFFMRGFCLAHLWIGELDGMVWMDGFGLVWSGLVWFDLWEGMHFDSFVHGLFQDVFGGGVSSLYS